MSGNKVQVASPVFLEEELGDGVTSDPWPSGMLSLHRVMWREDSAAKPSAPQHLGRKKQHYLLQLFKLCYRQAALVQTRSGGKPGVSVCVVIKWSSEEEWKINSLAWSESSSQRPAHLRTPAQPLCHLRLCRGHTVLSWRCWSIPKPPSSPPGFLKTQTVFVGLYLLSFYKETPETNGKDIV